MSKPLLLADILQDYFANSDEPLAVSFRERFGIRKGFPDAASPGDAQESGAAPACSDSLSVFNIPLEDWIDGQEVMQRLHISARTLQTLRSNGTLPHTRIRNKIYYRRQDIQRILAGHYGKKQEGGEDGRH